MKSFFIPLSLCLAVLASPLAYGNDAGIADMRAKLLGGEFDIAISLGEELGTAEGLSLAAESISAKVMLGYVDDPRHQAKRARALAAKALKMDENSQNALIQYALAYGFETQSSSPFRAWRKKLPQRTLAAIVNVREQYPNDARGDALLGAWHLGIVRKAGDSRADKMFKANESDGIAFYEFALSKAPSDIIILSNYTAALLTIDAKKHHDKAMGLLERIYSSPAKNAVEEDVKSRMEQFKAHLDDPKTLMMLAEKLLDGDRVNDLPPETKTDQ